MGPGQHKMPEMEQDFESERRHFAAILKSFLEYRDANLVIIDRWKEQLDSLSDQDKALLPRLAERIARYDECLEINTRLTQTIAKGSFDFNNGTGLTAANVYEQFPALQVKSGDEDKARSTLKQFVRDWADEGKPERESTYGPLLRQLEAMEPDRARRKGMKVLVPGAGLCRLVYEVCCHGFACQGNEFSVHMLLASYVILNSVQQPYSVEVCPFFTQPNNHLRMDDPLCKFLIPDVVPNLSMPKDADFSMSAGEFEESYSGAEHTGAWNAVLAAFFLDTAHNIFSYLRCIWRLLAPGGRLISIGPLLWHYADMPGEVSIELSWEEVKLAIEGVGFQIVHEELDLECKYTSNPRSLQQNSFKCIHFVALKPA